MQRAEHQVPGFGRFDRDGHRLEIAKLAQAGKLQGKSYVIGVENEKAAGYGKFGDDVPQKVKDKVAEAKKMMLEGKLKQK